MLRFFIFFSPSNRIGPAPNERKRTAAALRASSSTHCKSPLFPLVRLQVCFFDPAASLNRGRSEQIVVSNDYAEMAAICQNKALLALVGTAGRLTVKRVPYEHLTTEHRKMTNLLLAADEVIR